MLPGECRVQAYLEEGCSTLELAGELDMSSAPVLEQAAREIVVGGGVDELVLDLRELDFMDSSGIRALLVIKALCDEHGCEFSVLSGHRPQLQRLFDV